MDRALDAGITFFDSAEMYPVNPVRRETIGATEEIVGRWLAGAGRRERVEIATKMTGPSQMVRDGAPCDGATMSSSQGRGYGNVGPWTMPCPTSGYCARGKTSKRDCF
jgi:aryl-alcohol dehydrogenase-like predicted oxidoreductase